MMRRSRHHRRAFVLVAVLVIGGSALLVATSLLFLSQADITASAGVAGAARSRALAWSGVQAVMSSLNSQRNRILQGELPDLEREYQIYETETRLGLIRLLPIGGTGQRLVPEAGKLDINSVDAETLVLTGLVDQPTAEGTIAFRDRAGGGQYQSVAELLRAEGVTPAGLYGPIQDLTIMDDAQLEEGDVLERIAERLEGQSLSGLADLVTVYSFEPAIQRNGRKRINLNVEWSDDLGRRFEDRFGREASEALKRLFDAGATFESDAKIFQVLRNLNVQPAGWPDIVDAITTEAGDYHFGRLDINTAPLEALLTLPGVTPEQASQIVDMRSDLTPEEKSTIAWPAVFGILEAEAYDELAGRITTRSWTYRVRIAAGEVDAEQPEAAMENPVIFEAVIDLSAPQPRVAYLRDITMLQTAALLAASAPAAGAEGQSPLYDDEPAGWSSGDDDALADDEAEAWDEPAGFDDVMTMEDLQADWESDDEDMMEDELDLIDEAGSDSPGGSAADSSSSSNTDNPRNSPNSRKRIGRWRFGG